MQPTFSEFEQENAQSAIDALDLPGVQLQRNKKLVEVTFICSLGGVQWVLLYTHNDLMQKTSNDLDVHLIVVQVENDAVVALILKVSGKFNLNFINVFLENCFTSFLLHTFYVEFALSSITTTEETSNWGITAETGDWEEVNIEKPADHANLIDAELS